MPPHVACAAEHVASIKSIDGAMVLQCATRNLCNALGLPMVGADRVASLQTPVASDDNDAERCTKSTSSAKVFMKKPNSGPMK
jgi:hypothetical protein